MLNQASKLLLMGRSRLRKIVMAQSLPPHLRSGKDDHDSLRQAVAPLFENKEMRELPDVRAFIQDFEKVESGVAAGAAGAGAGAGGPRAGRAVRFDSEGSGAAPGAAASTRPQVAALPLDDETFFAEVNGGEVVAPPLTPWGGSRATTPGTRDLCNVTSVEELSIDYEHPLAVRRGETDVVPWECWRCCIEMPSSAYESIPLVLYRVDCVDVTTFDMTLYQAEIFSSFMSHPNVLSLYSSWTDEVQPVSPTYYKSVYLLTDEGVGGSLASLPRPGLPDLLRLLRDAAKGLKELHDDNIIHCKIRPSSILIDGEGQAIIGLLGRAEVDHIRQFRALFKPEVLPTAIPRVLVYWPPEFFRLQKYTPAADMWSLGVTFFEVATGSYPFPVGNVVDFKQAVLSVDVDWDLLNPFPELKVIIKNLLVENPEKRWDCAAVLTHIATLLKKAKK
jgi:hypothetical protein